MKGPKNHLLGLFKSFFKSYNVIYILMVKPTSHNSRLNRLMLSTSFPELLSNYPIFFDGFYVKPYYLQPVSHFSLSLVKLYINVVIPRLLLN